MRIQALCVVVIITLASASVSSYHSPHYVIESFKEGVSESNYTLPYLSVKGTHYGVGLAIGRVFADRIRGYMKEYSGLERLINFTKTTEGQRIANAYINNNAEQYPQYMDEITGYADGAGVSLYELSLLNVEDELDSIINHHIPQEADLDCTDLFIASEDIGYFSAHNEDADLFIKKYAYLVHTHIVDSQYGDDYKLWAYYYPGYLPGIAYAWNSFGLTFSQNAVFPNYTRVGGLGDCWISRDVISSVDMKSALSAVNVDDRAFGFSMNIGSVHMFAFNSTPILFNVEMSANDTNALEIGSNSSFAQYAHVNMYRHLDVASTVDDSSVHRLRRIREMFPASSGSDLLNILGDQQDQEYPIYRDSRLPDCCSTCSTVHFGLVYQSMIEVSIYIENPKSSDPLYVFQTLIE